MCFRGGINGVPPTERRHRSTSIVLLAGLLCCVLPISGACDPSALRLEQREVLELIFLDVGQGDAIVIRSPEGKVALVDAGPSAEIVGLLYSHGIDSIDIAIASHPHADHIGGMAGVIRSIPVRYYMDNGVPHTTATYQQLLRILRRSSITYLEATQRTIQLGSVDLHVLPLPSGGDWSLNDQSIGLVVQFGEFTALLTGDSEVGELNHFLSHGVADVKVLKAAHHGSRDGVIPAWLSATKPKVVVISVGADNPYRHPDAWALRYYEAAASEVYRTDRDGEVKVIAAADGGYAVSTGRRAIAPGPKAEEYEAHEAHTSERLSAEDGL